MPVIHYPPVVGGFEVFIENIAERIGRDTNVTVLTGEVSGAPKVETKEKLKIFRQFSLFPLKDRSGTSWLYVLTTIPMLFLYSLYLLWSRKANLMHAHGFLNGLVCMNLKLLTGVPYVLTIQSADWDIYHPEMEGSIYVKIQSWIERMVYKKARVCHAVSNDLAGHFKNQGRSDAVVIPNGVETDIFQPITEEKKKKVRQKYNLPKESFIVSTVSRLEYKNGVHDLIDAFAKTEDTSLFLAIIGDGKDRARLEERVENLGIDNQVSFMGEIDHEEVGELVAVSDIFARTPLSEGFGIVFLEAMAAGVPVIATSTGGIVDFTKDKETGLLCEPGDVSCISKSILDLKNDNSLRDRLIQNGKKMVHEEYSWDKISDEIFNLYKKAYQRSLKILITTGIYPPEVGGPANYSYELGKSLSRKGPQVKILAFNKFRKIPTGIRHILFFFVSFFKMIPARVSIALDTFSVGFPTVLAARILNKPVLIRTGGDFLWEEYVERTGKKILLSNFYKEERDFSLKERMIFKITKWTLQETSRLIFSTNYQREIFEKAYGLEKNKSVIVENAYLNKERKKFVPTNKNFYCAVRGLNWKNLDILKGVFEEIKDERPEIEVLIDTDIEREEVLEKISSSYATILVSLGDISPNFILESLYLKTPFILTEETGLKDRLANVGLFANPLDPEEIKEKVLYLANEENYQKQLKKIEEFSYVHTYDDIADEFLKIINKTI